jgi:hypothetical protein
VLSPTTLLVWIAHAAFWIVLVWGWAAEELGVRGAAIFVVLWIAGLLGLSYVPYGEGLFSPYVAMLDIVLVLIVVKGDIKLT